MDFELAASGSGWLAAAVGGASLGGTAAGAIRALFLRRKGFLRESRSSVSLLFLSAALAVAAGAFLLIYPPKPLLADRGLWLWTAVWAPIGLLSVLAPRWIGVPVLVLAFTALGLASSEASAWHVLVPGREAARFMPYETTTSGMRGDLSVPDRNAVPVLSKADLAASQCSMEARVAELSGPPAALFGSRRYILVRLTDGKGTELLRFPEKNGPLRSLLTREGPKGPWLRIRVRHSETRPLEELVSVAWSFDADGALRVDAR